MRTFKNLVLVGLGAGALAQPLSDSTTHEKRMGNTGWMASYANDDIGCHKAYLLNNGVDDNVHRPKLEWDHSAESPITTTFTRINHTDNVDIYFGTGTNKFDSVNFYHGVYDDSGNLVTLENVGSTVANDGYPGACISAAKFGYPWAAVGVTGWTD